MKFRALIFFGYLMAAAYTSIAEEAVAVAGAVGDLGDSRRLEFRGAKTFSAETLRSALMRSSDFLLASHPSARLPDFLEALGKMVRAGYEQAGFPDATAQARVESGRVRVTISEGMRYRAGAVRVRGAKRVPVDALVRRLIEQYPPEEALLRGAGGMVPAGAVGPDVPGGVHFKAALMQPRSAINPVFDRTGKLVEPAPAVWKKGEPVAFDQGSLDTLRATLTNALADFGFLFPKTSYDIVPDAKTGLAELVIDIADEGPMDVINEVEVTGQKKNSKQDIIQFLQITPGMNVNQSALTRMDLALWRSARFLDHHAGVERAPEDPTKIKLRIEVREHVPAPPLSRQLSQEEKILLRFCDWVGGISERDEDVVVSARYLWPGWPEGNVRIILSPKRGWMVSAEQGASGNQPSSGITWMGSPEEVGWYSRTTQRKMVLATSHPATATMHLLPNPDPAADAKFNFEISAGIGSAKEGAAKKAGFRFDILMAPVAFLDIAYRTNQHLFLAKDFLTVSNDEVGLKIEAATGRLLEFGLSSGTNAAVLLRMEKGAFDRASGLLLAQTSKQTNQYDARQPMTSVLGFLATEALETPYLFRLFFKEAPVETRRRAAAALSRLLGERVLSPLDAWLVSLGAGSGEDFGIPAGRPDSPADANNQMMRLMAAWVFKYCDEIFPNRSWPWTIAHEAVFVLSGKPNYTELELKRLYESDRVGPVGFLCAAKLLSLVHSPLAQNFAKGGLGRLLAQDFKNDYGLILQPESFFAKSIGQAAGALRTLPDEDLSAIVDVLPGGGGELVRNVARLSGSGKRGPLEATAQALDLYWEQSLRRQMQTAFLQVLNGGKQ